MMSAFPLAPRYRLDDESHWLEGIDPSRHYWIAVNGDTDLTIAIPGLAPASMEEFKKAVLEFRALQPGQRLTLVRYASRCSIYCVSQNCYAIEAEVQGALVWHLFDQETLQSLLMTAHPDWQCAARDLELGRRLLAKSWQQAVAA
ncbi:MAG: hypothetical protein VKJ46_16625 [Leptolyngbyaceae bacterium]|nr:hypothetical protein [Leptolyngbyaceae bacterium]